MKKTLFLTSLVLLGCDSGKLSDIEEASQQASTCKLHQIMPNECSKYDEALDIAELKATQAGIEHERIIASRQIGEKFVSGNIEDSPYQRVKRSLESKPFYIDALEENFTPYKVSCPSFDFDKMKPDIDKLNKAIEWIGRDKNQYQAVAYFQKGKVFNVLFTKTAPPCRPESYSDIQENFPIITEDQLTNFRNGVYLESEFYPGYNSVNVLIFDTFEEAKEKYHELTGSQN